MPKNIDTNFPDYLPELYKVWDFVKNQPREPKKEVLRQEFDFSLQERVLLKALILYFVNKYKKQQAANIVIGYDKNTQQRTRTHDVSLVTNKNIEKFLGEYKHNPIEVSAFLRKALVTIYKDQNIYSESKKFNRLQRYLQASLTLQVKLDRMSFLPNEMVVMEVPEYVPDGLSDMGSDPNTDPLQRDREKIRINKADIFSKYSVQLTELFNDISRSDLDPENRQIQGYIIEAVAKMVYDALPYDQNLRAGLQGVFLGRSINVNDIHDENLALCRHHALETQVLLQAMGINSQLFKCNVKFGNGSLGGHAANLAELDNSWFILDTTNPESINGTGKVYLKELDSIEKNPYKDNRLHTFVIDENTEYARTYILRDRMYYRIRDNEKHRLK